MAKRTGKTEAKFKRIAALNAMVDARDHESRDARRAKSKLANKWVNRRARNVSGLFKARNAQPGACVQVAV